MRSTREPDPLQAALSEHFSNHHLNPGGRYGAAYSGGSDSGALVRALKTFLDERGGVLYALYFDHGIREETERARERLAVEELCAVLAVPLRTGSATPGALKTQAFEEKTGLEEAARKARRAWLLARLSEDRLEGIFLAHVLEDQAETVLMRLFQGKSYGGLGAMAAVQGRFHRPFLDLPKKILSESLLASGLPWIEDSSNQNPAFLRNFLRLRVFPLVNEAFPRAVPALADFAGFYKEFWRSATGNFAGLWTCEIVGGRPAARASAALVLEVPATLRAYALLAGFDLVRSEGETLSQRALAPLGISRTWKNGILWTGQGWLLERRGESLLWRRQVVFSQKLKYLIPVDRERSLELGSLVIQVFKVAGADDVECPTVGTGFVTTAEQARDLPFGEWAEGKARLAGLLRSGFGAEDVPVLVREGRIEAVFGPAGPLWRSGGEAKLISFGILVKFTTRSDL